MTGEVMKALKTIRLPYALYEADIHRSVERALVDAGLSFEHEANLSKGCRIDYLVGGIGIEIKKGKPNQKNLLAQIKRYLSHESIEKLIVVSWHSVDLPDAIAGKKVEAVFLSQLWGISLP